MKSCGNKTCVLCFPELHEVLTKHKLNLGVYYGRDCVWYRGDDQYLYIGFRMLGGRDQPFYRMNTDSEADLKKVTGFNPHSFILEWLRLGASETEKERFDTIEDAFLEGVSLVPVTTWIQLSATVTEGGKTYEVILHQWSKMNV